MAHSKKAAKGWLYRFWKFNSSSHLLHSQSLPSLATYHYLKIQKKNEKFRHFQGNKGSISLLLVQYSFALQSLQIRSCLVSVQKTEIIRNEQSFALFRPFTQAGTDLIPNWASRGKGCAIWRRSFFDMASDSSTDKLVLPAPKLSRSHFGSFENFSERPKRRSARIMIP